MRHRSFLIISLLLLLLVACRNGDQPTTVPPAVPAEGTTAAPPSSDTNGQQINPTTSVSSPTAIPPTATPMEPMAATVNGRPIFLADYEKELSRYEQAQAELGLTPAEGDVSYRQVVLDALIETELIAQAAENNGIMITQEMIEARLVELEQTSGGAENFSAWLQANQWTLDEFRQALAAEMLTEKTVEFVTADVPVAVEQVRARYLQVDDSTLAQSLLEQYRSGADFATLAQQYSLDRITGESGGDLGFFAQGSLLVPEVEAAAFALQVGEVSEVITGARADGTGTTYYIVLVTERDPARQLNADLRFTLLQQKFEAWLAELWAQADIVRFVDASAQ